MIFESKYRRQAMMKWEQSKEETKQEIIQDVQAYQTKFMSIYCRIREISKLRFGFRKESSQ